MMNRAIGTYAASVAAFLLLSACGHSHSSGSYDSLQQCFDDHHNDESLPIDQSIVICCLEHPIGGSTTPCGDTQSACEAFVRDALDNTVTAADISAGCAIYIEQKAM